MTFFFLSKVVKDLKSIFALVMLKR